MKKRRPYSIVRLERYTSLLHLLGVFSDEKKKKLFGNLIVVKRVHLGNVFLYSKSCPR
jgi:hypothetical protein